MSLKVDIQETLNRAKTSSWFICPLCGEEWSKLKDCWFYWENRWDRDSSCVRCAETPKNIQKINERYLIPGVKIDVGFIGKSRGPAPHLDILWRNSYAAIHVADVPILLSATAASGPIITMKDEEPLSTSSMFYAWGILEIVYRRVTDSRYFGKYLKNLEVEMGMTQ